ncbi:hypothetical protein ACFSL6_20190 [Paenibacillus thailandensis]|uniref:Secreted protein n=1 Tax=Paenibacillus thailandensis TaxID=393250 RepID=A0ABW5R0A1_9BACL
MTMNQRALFGRTKKMAALASLLALLALPLAACGTSVEDTRHAAEGGGHEHGGAEAGEGVAADPGSASSAGHDAAEHRHGEAESGSETVPDDLVQAEWTYNNGDKPEAGKETTVRIMLTRDGQPIESFDTTHEQKQHLIIVSSDLSYFSHIHPVFKGDGLFEVETVFPTGGEYTLIADFVPSGGSAMHRMTVAEVSGAEAASVPLEPQTQWNATVDGMKAALTFDGKLKAGRETTLSYELADAETGEPVTDLEPYLGEIGHVVILSQDAEQYLHVHPLEDQGSGPEAKFMTNFPSPGVYKIWAQFKRSGEIVTIPFVVEIES